MSDLREIQVAAEEYIERGWPIIPIPSINGQPAKGPTQVGWPDKLIESGCAASILQQNWNIGLLLRDVVDTDLDCREAREAAPIFLPPTGLIYGHAPALLPIGSIRQQALCGTKNSNSNMMMNAVPFLNCARCCPPPMAPSPKPFNLCFRHRFTRVVSSMCGTSMKNLPKSLERLCGAPFTLLPSQQASQDFILHLTTRIRPHVMNTASPSQEFSPDACPLTTR